MGQTTYTEEQLSHMYNNFRDVHNKLEIIFLTIANEEEKGISLADLYRNAKVSKFIGDKCITALQLPGLIYVEEIGIEKRCAITEAGKMMKEHILRKKLANGGK